MKRWVILVSVCIFFCHCNEPEQPHPLLKLSENKVTTPSQNPLSNIPKKPVPQRPNTIRQKNPAGEKIKPKSVQLTKAITSAVPLRTDSLVISRIQWLRRQNILIDISEPLSREFLLSREENPPFQSMIELSRESILKINFDNDILNNTDQFYTNGLRFDLISPFLIASPLNLFMVPYWHSGMNYYGACLVQNMYTPSTTKTGGIHYGDRPYAAYLYFGTYKITNDPARKYRQTGELDLGVIGPYSLGEFVQKSFHAAVPTNNEPLGWEYQIRNDVIANYNLNLEKGLVSEENIEINTAGGGSFGTLYTNLEGGFCFRAGWFNPYFSDLGIEKSQINRENHRRNNQIYLYGHSTGRLVGYDATLQGGLFNHTNPYTINARSVSRFMLENSAGVAFTSGAFRLEAEQYLLSPEFHHGWWHWWVHFCLSFSL
ncbi:MAG: lipid A deacylase LpxR family protein [Bacteroidota bacterium]|nr:lipid A deacylase LpxR family protein [Bacteroidota bacterium]